MGKGVPLLQSRPMGLTTTVYARSAEVDSRLNELGLKREILLEAVYFGATYAAECTRHDPSSMAGLLLWGKTVRRLRDLLIPFGWNVSNKRNFPLTVHPGGMWAIGVASGDEHTGIPDETPSTQYVRGPETRRVVDINQLSFAALSADFAELDAVLTRQTWFLLHHRDDDADEIRVELSLAAEMTPDNFVTRWTERIILTWADGGSPIAHPVPGSGDGPEDEEIDIPVLKKA